MGEPVEEAEALSWWTYVGVGLLWYASNEVVSAAGVTGEAAYLWIAAAFLAVFGGACLYNASRCGALHCRISGVGYLGLALLGAASAVGLVDVSRGVLMAAFGLLFLASYAIEILVQRRSGSPT